MKKQDKPSSAQATSAEGFHISDIQVFAMDQATKLVEQYATDFLDKFISPDVDYHPHTLFIYETLVNDNAICAKGFFDSALDEICRRFLAIPDGDIQELLSALGVIYPSALAARFSRYIDIIREYCRS